MFAILMAPLLGAAVIGQGLSGQEAHFSCITASNSEPDTTDSLTRAQDIFKVATALAGVVGLAGASCMGLAKKRKEKFDSRLITAIALFPTMPLVVHLIGKLVMSQMH